MLDARDTSPKPERDRPTDVDDDVTFRDRGRKIRCPRCRWRPGRDDRWVCNCKFAWNTFETAGRCPACGTQWEWTQCLKCNEWSPHRDWYDESTPTPHKIRL